jgi:hypothetical protein
MPSHAFTAEPKRLEETDAPLAVEYRLFMEDHLALLMFVYDKARAEARRGVWFWVTRSLSLAGAIPAFVYALTARLLPEGPGTLLIALAVMGFVVVVLLDTILPGGLLFAFFRPVHQGRMMLWIRAGRRVGLYNPRRRDRLVLTEEGFIESNDLEENAGGVENIEHKETRVRWSAVSSIDVTGEHAFFNVKDRGHLILPRFAFATEGSFRSFVDMARGYWEADRLAPAFPLG